MPVLPLWQVFQNCSWLATMLKYSLRAGNQATYWTSDSVYSLNNKHLSPREKKPTKYCICICNKILWCNTVMMDKQWFYQQRPPVEGNGWWYFKWDQNFPADAECSLNKMRILELKKLESLVRWRRKHCSIDLNTAFFIMEYTGLHTFFQVTSWREQIKNTEKEIKGRIN